MMAFRDGKRIIHLSNDGIETGIQFFAGFFVTKDGSYHLVAVAVHIIMNRQLYGGEGMDGEGIIQLLKGRIPKVLGSEDFREYAILVPLMEVNGETHILFEVRSYKMRRQPGEICFPGGRIDKGDKDASSAAIRETSEELGINQDLITDIHPLDYLVSPFGTIIYPFAGRLNVEQKDLQPNGDEVEEVFTSPIKVLQEKEPELYDIKFSVQPEANFPYKQIPGGENYDWQARSVKEHFYYYEDKVIWGLTARVLHHFINIVSNKKSK
jgi:peroxisomal coenzyme A diphosphatase NUDT7